VKAGEPIPGKPGNDDLCRCQFGLKLARNHQESTGGRWVLDGLFRGTTAPQIAPNYSMIYSRILQQIMSPQLV
jgi:hypothetical protein